MTEHGVQVCLATIWKTLGRFGLTFKTIVDRAGRASQAEERPAPPQDGRDRRPHARVRVRRLRDRPRDYIDRVLKASLGDGMMPDHVLTDEAATLLAAKLKTPLQIGQHLVRAFEAGFEIGAKPITAGVAEAVLSSKLDELEPQLTRNGYDLRSLVEQFDAKPAAIRRLLRVTWTRAVRRN